jgi:uncharacterized membrane protein YccF (DUF307 family)
MSGQVSETPPGPGWWKASDGQWYAPHLAPTSAAPPSPPAQPVAYVPVVQPVLYAAVQPAIVAAPVVVPGSAPGAGSVALNVIWLVFSGFWLAMAYLISGVFQCIFIITIPFGIQSFKLAGFALWPFGRAIVRRPGASQSLSLLGNVIWFCFSGIWLAIAHLMAGVILCCTIIGIPLGIANFKMISLALLPFGKDVVKKGDLIGYAPGSYVVF